MNIFKSLSTGVTTVLVITATASGQETRQPAMSMVLTNGVVLGVGPIDFLYGTNTAIRSTNINGRNTIYISANAGGAAGSGAILVETNSTAVAVTTNINLITGAGLLKRVTNNVSGNRVDIFIDSVGTASNTVANVDGVVTNLTVHGNLEAIANFKSWGAYIAVPVTNHANALTVTTNWYQRRPSATNYTLTFSGTAADGTRMQFDAQNTEATNYTITIPSSLSADAPGNPAITTVLCRSNSVTEIFWIRKSGAWHVSSRQPSGVVFDEGDNIYTAGFVRPAAVVATNSITSQGTLAVSGASALAGNVTATNIDAGHAKFTNNVAFITADINPASQATNFVADYLFGARTILMTNHAWFVHVTNHPAANFWRGYSAIFRNNSGGALTIGMAAAFKRAGTNNVSVPNGARAKVIFEPDGTGGTDNTNHLGQIILFSSP